MSQTWKGVFVAVVTPFDKNGGVAFPEFEKHLEYLADAGVHGFVPCGTTGESPTVTAEERKKILEMAREVSNRRQRKLIAGCGGNSTPRVVALVVEAAALGCDAVLVSTPYYNKPSQAGLIAHYEAIADASRLPIFLYNVPSRTGVNLNPDTVEILCRNPKIVGIKEAGGQHRQWLDLSTRLDLERTSFMSGDDDAFATILALGGSGIISASANVAPERFVDIYNAYTRGDWAQVFEGQKRLLPLVEIMFMETNPAPAKYALELMGRMERNVRLPLMPVTELAQTRIAQVLKQLEVGRA